MQTTAHRPVRRVRGRTLTTPQASRHATDRIVAPHSGALTLGSDPAVSRPSCQPATGPPASYPDRTSSGRRRRAFEHEETPWYYVTVSPPALLGHERCRLEQDVNLYIMGATLAGAWILTPRLGINGTGYRMGSAELLGAIASFACPISYAKAR